MPSGEALDNFCTANDISSLGLADTPISFRCQTLLAVSSTLSHLHANCPPWDCPALLAPSLTNSTTASIILYHILDGYNNVLVMQSTVKDLMVVLQDPELPATGLCRSSWALTMPSRAFSAPTRRTMSFYSSEIPPPRLSSRPKGLDSLPTTIVRRGNWTDGIRSQDFSSADRLQGGQSWRSQHSYEVLHELVYSEYTVFDVLPTFYDYPDTWVALAALEVYVR
ncbi:hypothetical protein PCASD_21694 [Puccinia coronata f. sp. avenae]|uniref:Acetyl-CoA carboxylase central domain-containing protein n=1 Tax=Puccinia coronata f. sp. avenae TaxID=200324 RepID=A0A2N5TRB1_9BASI|nr:hypothetical protein PCASD_22786 [Puccinia coronata f. sp. avenae]PLW28040.1 hypothetical protein PCASD_21694 [Puccinia coronata f. sp. avenae]